MIVRLIAVVVGIFFGLVFLLFQAQGIYGGDSGDLVTAAFECGVPHPPGYPLYTSLGCLVSRIPAFTPSWRVGLLSSVPHAITLSLIFLLTYQLSSSLSASLFSVLLLAGNYVFFLYAVTPEVFALYDFFVVSVTYTVIRFSETKNRRYLLLAIGLFSLSLAHHHVILFMLPALLLIFRNQFPRIQLALRLKQISVWMIAAASVMGMLPYLYIVWAAQRDVIVNWNRATTITNFIELVTRSYYGTFFSGGGFGQLPIQRLLGLKAYWEFLFMDLRLPGIILLCVGLYRLWTHKRSLRVFYSFTLLLVGPLFLMYASFPLTNRFTLATFERFLLPSYVLMAPLIGVGFSVSMSMLSAAAKSTLHSVSPKAVTYAAMVLLFLYPFTTLAVSLGRFSGISSDYTADNLARDILGSVEPKGVLLLGGDTALFTSQYLRYALHYRPDVALLHIDRLGQPEYKETIRRIFPGITMATPSAKTFVSDFIADNKDTFSIYSNVRVASPKSHVWVPEGLIFKLTPVARISTMSSVLSVNASLWQTYHNPMRGILSVYPHMMLSDVPNVYQKARFEYGNILLHAGLYEEAQKEFKDGLETGGEQFLSELYARIGITALFLRQCDLAIDSFSRAQEAAVPSDKNIVLYKSVTYRDCMGDTETAKKLQQEFENLRRQDEIRLERL